MLMSNWLPVGTDNFSRDASDTESLSLGRRRNREVAAETHEVYQIGRQQRSRGSQAAGRQASGESHASFHQLCNLRIIGDEDHRPGFFLGTEPAQ